MISVSYDGKRVGDDTNVIYIFFLTPVDDRREPPRVRVRASADDWTDFSRDGTIVSNSAGVAQSAALSASNNNESRIVIIVIVVIPNPTAV